LILIYLNGTIAAFSFAQLGAKSVFGWVNLTLASGFYLGNIYGAYESAKRLNNFIFIKTNYEIKNRIINLDF
jgi:ABC-type sugar transport system substrate-binding protein